MLSISIVPELFYTIHTPRAREVCGMLLLNTKHSDAVESFPLISDSDPDKKRRKRTGWHAGAHAICDDAT